MRLSPAKRVIRVCLWLLAETLVVVLVAGISVWADSSSRVRTPGVAGCYCGCASSKSSAGCAKMCELPKYASRWWATTCGKPRVTPKSDNPEAGPKLPHPARAERASR